MKNSKSIKQAIINALIQGGVEASEEGTTEIANILTNAVIMGGQSDWNKLVPQRAVRAFFPAADSAFGSMKELIRSGLEEDAVIEGKRDKRLPAIVDEIQRTIPKTEAEIEESPVDQADRDLEGDVQFDDRDITEDPLYPDTERERSAFNRSFINKTTSLKPGEEKDIIIITADYVYVVRACGASGLNPYVGEILGKEFLDDDYLSEAREELKHGVNKHRERNDSPTQTIRYNRRRGHVSYRSVKERLKAEGNDYLLADEPDGDSEGDRGQSGRDPQGLKAGLPC